MSKLRVGFDKCRKYLCHVGCGQYSDAPQSGFSGSGGGGSMWSKSKAMQPGNYQGSLRSLHEKHYRALWEPASGPRLGSTKSMTNSKSKSMPGARALGKLSRGKPQAWA